MSTFQPGEADNEASKHDECPTDVREAQVDIEDEASPNRASDPAKTHESIVESEGNPLTTGGALGDEG